MKPIVTLTLNSSIDVSCQAKQVRPVRKVRTFNYQYDPGGCGINVARVIRELGGQPLAVYLSGGFTGQALDELITASNIQCLRIPIEDSTRMSHVVYDGSTGQEYRFTPEGPIVQAAELQACLDALDGLDFDFLVASGSLPRDTPSDFYVRVADLAERKGARMAVDTSGDALRAILERGVYLAKPSIGELEALIGRKLSDKRDLAKVAHNLVNSKAAQILAVSLGHDGALLTTAIENLRLQPPSVTVRSAVGAGDSFVGALTLTLAEGRSLEEAFAWAVAAGTASVLTPGTRLCRREDVERLYQEIRQNVQHLPVRAE